MGRLPSEIVRSRQCGPARIASAKTPTAEAGKVNGFKKNRIHGMHRRGHRRCDGCEKVEIRAIGSATGDIASPRLAIAEGGCLHGAIQMPSPRCATSGMLRLTLRRLS